MNKKALFCFVVFFITASSLFAQQTFTIEDAIARAKAQSPDSKREETKKENRYWNYRYFRSNYNPQLRLAGSLPDYNKNITSYRLPDGSLKFSYVNQMNNSVWLGLKQPLVWTGGEISANTTLDYSRNYLAVPGESLPVQWSGTVMNIRISQPLFSFNSLRWEKKIQPLLFEESKREYVEQMEFISMESVSRFFNVLQEQINLQIANFNLANNDTIYKIEQGRYNIGTTSQDKLLQVELQLLRSRQDVMRANLGLETARLHLQFYLGLNDGEKFPELILPESIPQFDVTVNDALLYAKQNRAAFISFERRRLEADRELAQAKGSRFESTIDAAYGLNNNSIVMSDVYIDPLEQQQVKVSFSIPIMDWGRNKSNMRRAIANKKLTDYTIAQEEINFEQAILTQVRQFETLRLQIEISKKADEVATERYNVAQNRYLIGKIDITNLNIALQEKDNAKRTYLEALKLFWTAYYDLRRLTLYDFSAKQLLYTPE
jgi:outer membrane protein TolC